MTSSASYPSFSRTGIRSAASTSLISATWPENSCGEELRLALYSAYASLRKVCPGHVERHRHVRRLLVAQDVDEHRGEAVDGVGRLTGGGGEVLDGQGEERSVGQECPSTSSSRPTWPGDSGRTGTAPAAGEAAGRDRRAGAALGAEAVVDGLTSPPYAPPPTGRAGRRASSGAGRGDVRFDVHSRPSRRSVSRSRLDVQVRHRLDQHGQDRGGGRRGRPSRRSPVAWTPTFPARPPAPARDLRAAWRRGSRGPVRSGGG